MLVLGIAIFILTACNQSSPEKGDVSKRSVTPDVTLPPSATWTPRPTSTPTPTITPSPTIIGGFPGKYLSIERDGDTQILVLRNVDGKLIDTVFEYPIDTTDNTTDFSRVMWSPTGTHFVVLYWQEGGHLHIFEEDGTEVFSVDTGINFYGGSVGQANWSNDGKYLAFPSIGSNYYTDIYTVDADGNELLQLTNTTLKDSSPIFSPDNSKIIYSVEGTLYMMSVDGLDKQSLTTGPSSFQDWSPDGNSIIYNRASPADLFIQDLDTNDIRRITFNYSDMYEGDASYSKDGAWFFYTEYGFPSSRKPQYGENLYSVNLENNNERIFLGNVYSYEISPDNTRIFFYGSPDAIVSPEIPDSVGYFAINFDGTDFTRLSYAAYRLLSGKGQPGSDPESAIDPSIFNYATPTLTPTPMSAWEPFPDPPLFDDFSTENFDSFGSDLESEEYYVAIKDGKLIFSNSFESGTGSEIPLNVLSNTSDNFVYEADLKIHSSSSGRVFVKTQIYLDFEEYEWWWSQCALGWDIDDPTFYCSIAKGVDGKWINEYRTESVPIYMDKWYTVRIEINGSNGALQFYLDNDVIGTFSPVDAIEISEGLNITPKVGVWSISGNIDASIDNIYISSPNLIFFEENNLAGSLLSDITSIEDNHLVIDNTNSNDWYGQDGNSVKITQPFKIAIQMDSTENNSLSLSGRINEPGKEWWEGIHRMYIRQYGQDTLIIEIRDGRNQDSNALLFIEGIGRQDTFSIVFLDSSGKKFQIVNHLGEVVGEYNVSDKESSNFGSIELPNGLFPDGDFYPGVLMSPNESMSVYEFNYSPIE